MLMMICLTTSVGALRLHWSALIQYLLDTIASLLNQTLVDSHLESIPGLGSFTTGCLSGSDLEGLGWETDRTLYTEFLALGTLDELLADLLERLDFAGGQGDADLVSFLRKFIISKILLRGEKVRILGLRRTPSLAFGRTLLRGISFTTRTFQLRQSDEGDRCALRCRWGIKRRRRELRIWGCGREVLAWLLSDANLIGWRLSSALLHCHH